jgi:L-serine dehydratase
VAFNFMKSNALPVSIFNDVIGPVMRGPSSSHCAAALRIGRLARNLMGDHFQNVLIEFDRSGSLPTTHASQGSDMGLFGGLLGWEADDERLPDSASAIQNAGIEIVIETVDVGDEHPNTYRLTLSNANEQHFLKAISTGGGMIEVLQIDQFAVSMFGDYFVTLLWTSEFNATLRQQLLQMPGVEGVEVHTAGDEHLIEIRGSTFVSNEQLASLGAHAAIQRVRRLNPVLPVLSRREMTIPFRSCQEMLQYDAGEGSPLWKLAMLYEAERGNLSDHESLQKMVGIIRILRRSIQSGLAGTQYADRILGAQSPEFQRQMNAGNLIGGSMFNRVILYVTALMEVKSSMGVIVAAPTAGACAALPGVVIAVAEELQLDEQAMAKAMLAAGLMGVFIATPWTFAAEVGGCQAEGGAAAAAMAAALVTLTGGTLSQATAASAMALQSMIGLICDPVGNRVEVPCLGKNVMAATNALACANMALANYDPVIPFDEVVATAKRVAEQMPRELRCTNLGGLSITPTSQAIEQRLAILSNSQCGQGCGCAR